MEVIPQILDSLNNTVGVITDPPDPELQRKIQLDPEQRHTRWQVEPPSIEYLPSREEAFQRHPFPSREAEQAYADLERFYERFRGLIYLNAETGLPNYMYCDYRKLDIEQRREPEEIVAWFLEQHARVLGGLSSGIHVQPTWWTHWDNAYYKGTHLLRFNQISAEGIPVRGSHLVFTFDSDNQLALITSSLYPATAEELPAFPATEFKPEEFKQRLEELGTQIGGGKRIEPNERQTWPQRCIYPFRVTNKPLATTLASLWKYEEGNWRLQTPEPAEPPLVERGEYRPAWIVPFLDQYEHHWFAFVDANNGEILNLSLAEAHAFKPYVVFPSTKDALDVQNVLNAQDGAAMQNLANRLTFSINLGDNADTLRQANSVSLRGNRLHDPQDTNENPAVGAFARERFLGANIFFHVRQMQAYLGGILENSTHKTPVNLPLDNPIQTIVATLNPEDSGSPEYKVTTGALCFTTGSGGAHPITEPGFDGEVIAHEFTHAFVHYFYHQLFQINNNEVLEKVSRGFDEGVAFYFACLVANNSLWGEYAYAQWQRWRDIGAIDLRYNQVVAHITDPAGLEYGIGMWWACVLWNLYHKLGAPFNLILLNTLAALPTVTLSAETQNLEDLEQVRIAFRQIGAALLPFADQNQQGIIHQVLQDADLPLP